MVPILSRWRWAAVRLRACHSPSRPFTDAAEAVISAKRVSAGCDKREHPVEGFTRQTGIGRGPADFCVKRIGLERITARPAHQVLGQHIECTRFERFAIQRVFRHRIARRQAFKMFKTIGRHQHCTRDLVQPVIGAAQPLDQTRRALGRTELHHQIHITPVNAQIERGGAHHSAQLSGGHCAFHLAALFDAERTMVQRYRQIIIIDPPELLEGKFGLRARIDEYQRGAGRLQQLIDTVHGVLTHMARPWNTRIRGEDRHVRFGPARTDDNAR